MGKKIFIKSDRSFLLLLETNLLVILLAVIERWSLSQVMWIYWGQSVVIGFFNVKRILCLHKFSTEGFKINGHYVQPTKKVQRQVAFFFAIHYGFFHAIYLIFLMTGTGYFSRIDMLGLIGGIALFAVNHSLSFRHNVKKDLSRTPNIGTIMFFPYARIIPMHLTIIFGAFSSKSNVIVLVLFLLMKTAADLLMHTIEHRSSKKIT